MEGADVRRAVAEERDRDARLVAQLERERRAGDRRQPAADDGVRAEVAALDVVQVHRAAVPVRAALDLAVELGHHRVGGRAARERVAVRAMGRREDVAVLHRAADADRDGLLADRDVQEARAARPRETALPPFPRSGESGACRGGTPSAAPAKARPSLRPWPRRKCSYPQPYELCFPVDGDRERASLRTGRTRSCSSRSSTTARLTVSRRCSAR